MSSFIYFSICETYCTLSALSVPKAPHGPAFCTSPAPSRALLCRAHGFAVKRGPRPRTQRKRAPAIWQGPLKMGKEKAGTYLFSQVVSNQVSSAQPSLTSVFGMGTGGSLASSAPALDVFPSTSLFSLKACAFKTEQTHAPLVGKCRTSQDVVKPSTD